MILSAWLPIADLRLFVEGDTGRLVPATPARGSSGFLRGFGALQPEAPTLVSDGQRALRLHSSPTGRGTGERGTDPYRCIERRLAYDGVAGVTYQLTLGAPPVASQRRAPLHEILERFVEVRAVVQGRRGPTAVRLARAGHFLASSWAAATTAAARRRTSDVVRSDPRPTDQRSTEAGAIEPPPSEPWWITAGRPAFLMRLRRGELDTRGMGRIGMGGVHVMQARLPFSGAGCPIWLIEVGDDDVANQVARARAAEIEGALLEQHARRETLGVVLAALGQGHLAPAPRSAASDRLQAFLNDTIGTINRQQRRLPRQLFAREDGGRGESARGDTPLELVERQLRDVVQVRGNIRRKTLEWMASEAAGVGQRSAPPTTDRVATPSASAGAEAGGGPAVKVEVGLPLGAPAATPSIVAPRDPLPVVDPAAPEISVPLYPRLGAEARDVEPGQLVRFWLQLATAAPVGASGELSVTVGAGAAATVLHAAVSSSDWSPESPWCRDFTVRRDGSVPDGTWEFGARAIGDRASYGLRVVFTAAGLPAGALSLRLARRGQIWSLASDQPAAPETLHVALGGGPPATIKITLEGPNRYRIALFESGGAAAEPQWWDASQNDWYFGELERATDYTQLKEAGWGLSCDLPPAVREFCFRSALAGAPLLISSAAPIAPFELLAPSDDGPLLGLDRPVTRWPDTVSYPTSSEVLVAGGLALRPTYCGDDALPSAGEEERLLGELMAGRKLTLRHAGTRAELDAAMQLDTVRLLHFAGHAGGDPAYLRLEDQPIRPTYFGPSKPLMKQRPFLFMNGCRAGRGRAAAPSQQSNMMNILLQSAAGAVAPLVTVKSEAALVASRTFYQAALDGKTIAESVQQIHRLAADCGARADFAASWLSYLAFVPPGLKLRFA